MILFHAKVHDRRYNLCPVTNDREPLHLAYRPDTSHSRLHSWCRIILIVWWGLDDTAPKHIGHHRVCCPCSTSANESQIRRASTACIAYKTAFTTSRMTAPLAISSFSTPCRPSARVGPRLRSRTGLCSSNACLNNLVRKGEGKCACKRHGRRT